MHVLLLRPIAWHQDNVCRPNLLLFAALPTGGTPFAQLGDDELRIYRRICRCSWHWPATPAGHDISADARDLVAQLLQRDPAKRLGMVRGKAGHSLLLELYRLVCLCSLIYQMQQQPPAVVTHADSDISADARALVAADRSWQATRRGK